MYLFYLKNILLPVTPKKVTITGSKKNTTITLLNEGEINILKQEGLESIKFDISLPNVKYPYAVYQGSFKDAEYFIKKINKLKGKPFQFIITRNKQDNTLIFNTNIKVAIENITQVETATDGTDVTLQIELKKYKHYGIKTYTIPTIQTTESTNTIYAGLAQNRETSTSPAPTQNTKYIVKKGDTLWSIAKYYYGNGALYTKIYEMNKNIIDNPSMIYPNQERIIPT